MLCSLPKLRGLSLIVASAFCLLHTAAQAELDVVVVGGGNSRIPVAIADFAGDGGASRAVTSVIRNDLEHSGLFKLIDTSGMALNENTAPSYGDWKSRGADALAAGSANQTSANRVEASFRL